MVCSDETVVSVGEIVGMYHALNYPLRRQRRMCIRARAATVEHESDRP